MLNIMLPSISFKILIIMYTIISAGSYARISYLTSDNQSLIVILSYHILWSYMSHYHIISYLTSDYLLHEPHKLPLATSLGRPHIWSIISIHNCKHYFFLNHIFFYLFTEYPSIIKTINQFGFSWPRYLTRLLVYYKYYFDLD